MIFALKDSPIHMGLVHDEYGHFRGLVTTADILGSIVGEFSDRRGPAGTADGAPRRRLAAAGGLDAAG